jgi:hypothetical protein
MASHSTMQTARPKGGGGGVEVHIGRVKNLEQTDANGNFSHFRFRLLSTPYLRDFGNRFYKDGAATHIAVTPIFEGTGNFSVL